MHMKNVEQTDFDTIIVGAGISGIAAAVHLKDKCPDQRFCILEGRPRLGGTWDLFKYPGIRSDSDMHTLGYKFKPWTNKKSIADGPSILAYLKETVDEYDLNKTIQYNHKVVHANWNSASAKWEITADVDGAPITLTAQFLFMGAGYFKYETGYTPDFPGREAYKGEVIHPQNWSDTTVHCDKKVVIIGSGATAVTIVPAIADETAHVTMLQRSPSYMQSAPSTDWLSNNLRKIMSDKLAYNIVRTKNIWRQALLYRFTQGMPKTAKKWALSKVQKSLGKDYNIDPHFIPHYAPWDERFCLVPDNDFFDAVRTGKATIVTDHIDHFDETGIRLKSGGHLEADLIVTATGLDLEVLGGTQFSRDGQAFNFTKSFAYEGMMYSGLPNMLSVFGYVNASWTLRSDIVAEFFCRLIQHMKETGTSTVTPVAPDGMAENPWIDFAAGYIQRSMHRFPKQGDREPWLNTQNYLRDRKALLNKDIDGDGLEFTTPVAQTTILAAE